MITGCGSNTCNENGVTTGTAKGLFGNIVLSGREEFGTQLNPTNSAEKVIRGCLCPKSTLIKIHSAPRPNPVRRRKNASEVLGWAPQHSDLPTIIYLNAAANLSDLRAPPGNRLEALKADRAGQHSIRINDQFRICFVWTLEGPAAVEITDYH